MITTSVSKLKNSLSAYLAKVRGGESVLILDRDVPVAEINPLSSSASAPNAHLQALAAKGLVRLGDAEVVKNWRPKPVKTKNSVLDALLDERREGR